LNCRWLPFWATRYQPSSLINRITARTFNPRHGIGVISAGEPWS
jgi:hypothetical protein